MADEILFETQGSVAVITINRPEKRNAITPPMQKMLRDAFKRLRDDDDLRVAVFTGAGDKSFTAGADLRDIESRGMDQRRMRFWRSNPEERYIQVYKPVVAAVNGFCYGDGFNLLCAMTDIRIAADTATFSYAEVRFGFSGNGGALQWLPRQVPYAKAMEWLLTGKVVDAQEALQAGLINEVVPLAQVRDRALEVAQQLAKLPPLTLRAIKEAVVRGLSMPVPDAIQFSYALESLLYVTDDAEEGPRAFIEKREPDFKGR